MSRNEMATCPYNPEHRVSACRLQYHIVKCREKNAYLAKGEKVCPFNARHRMTALELKDHMITCPDRDLYEKDSASSRPVEEILNRAHNYAPSYCTSQNIESSEDWESEIDDDNSVVGSNVTSRRSSFTQPDLSNYSWFGRGNLLSSRSSVHSLSNSQCSSRPKDVGAGRAKFL